MKRKRFVVLGTMGNDPFAGMAWMHMQIAVGLKRLGHEVRYIELTSCWPFDPDHQCRVCDSSYAVQYIGRITESFGMGAEWAYCRTYADRQWFGMSGAEAEEWLLHSDAVFNIAGASEPRSEDRFKIGTLVYFGTDPVYHEIAYENGDSKVIRNIQQHDAFVTYGENIGTPFSPIPPLPRLHGRTRQPILVDLWETIKPPRDTFTTVGNWRQIGHDITFRGERYFWSKHHEFLKVVDVPRLAGVKAEFATGLHRPEQGEVPEGEVMRATHMTEAETRLLVANGWSLTDAFPFSKDPWPYRSYVQRSKGEFTVARDMNVRLRSGWFSERSACYLAAGRPVVTQNTGFDRHIPTGCGLFSYDSADEAVEALKAIAVDYAAHSKAAREIAWGYFRAETVLAKMLGDLGF